LFAATNMADLAALHYGNFLYATVARRWHALWCRWSSDGTLKESFGAERIFTPSAEQDAVDMAVIYHYGDDRGTVSEGPRCGPWRITPAQHSASDGLQHPASPEMTTLLLPDGPSAWCMKSSTLGQQPCAVELFLHHGEHLRMSAGVIHAATGELVQLSSIREDARGVPSTFWTSSTDATATDAAGLAAALEQVGAPIGFKGTGHAITAGLHQRVLDGVEWSDMRMAKTDASDVVLLCPDAVAVVGSRKRVEGQPFSSACAWWPSAADGGAKGGVLYTIEALWDAHGALAELRHVRFAA